MEIQMSPDVSGWLKKKGTERIIAQISTGTLYLHSRHIGSPSQMDSSSKITSSIFVVWV